MGTFYTIETAKDGLTPAISALFQTLLTKKVVEAVMLPVRQPHGDVVAQALVTDPARLADADPFAPIALSNAGKMTASLTAQPTGKPVAAVLRSCEVRAYLELVKLRQGQPDELLLIGLDCLGRYENGDFRDLTAKGMTTEAFLAGAAAGETTREGVDLAPACALCERPVADAVDLRLCVLGGDAASAITLEAVSEKGAEAAAKLGLAECAEPQERARAVKKLVAARTTAKEARFAEFEAQTNDLSGLADAVAGCIGCYNCRVACPVCYCRECVFVTDTFRHESEKYLLWSAKWGQIQMPTDRVMFHLTRMLHMSALCVGCGQCSSACPNDVPVMELFRTVAARTQARFEYTPGLSLDDPQPLAVFHAEEFGEVTGQTK